MNGCLLFDNIKRDLHYNSIFICKYHDLKNSKQRCENVKHSKKLFLYVNFLIITFLLVDVDL